MEESTTLQAALARLHEEASRLVQEEMIHGEIAKAGSYGLEAQRVPQLAFLHISKTAGTSVHRFLTNAIVGRIFHGDFDAATRDSLRPYALITGHMSYNHVRKFRKPCHLLTFLRDPVDRVISTYFYLRGWSDHASDSQAVSLAKELSFRQFLECDHPDVVTFTRDHQTYTLASDYRTHRSYDSDMVLNQAWGHLQAFWFVGFVEHFDKSMKRLCRLLGVPFKRIEVSNATQGRLGRAEMDASDLALARQLNPLDCKLYDLAWSRFSPALFARSEQAAGLVIYRNKLRAERRAARAALSQA